MKRESVQNLIKYGVGLGILVTTGGLALMAAWSIAQWVLAGLVLWSLAMFTPTVARAVAYGNFQLLLFWAKQNPVAELMIQRTDDHNSLMALNDAIAKLQGEAGSYWDRLKVRLQKYGEDENREHIETYARLVLTIKQQQEQSDHLNQELDEFDKIIDRTRDDVEMARITDKTNRLIDRLTNKDPMSRILRDASIQEARRRLHESRARADQLARKNGVQIKQTDLDAIVSQINGNKDVLLTATSSSSIVNYLSCSIQEKDIAQ